MNGFLAAAAPLMLAGLGALLSDFSGVLGIFIEGFMVLGAFLSWAFSLWAGSVPAGVALSAALAGLLGWGLARFVRVSGANPFIAGLALNLCAEGAAAALSQAWFGAKGVLRDAALSAPPPLRLPLIDRLPVLGPLLSGCGPFVYLAWGLTALAAFVMSRTVTGLRLRASGLSAEAAQERGVDPARYREGAWAAAALLAALGGAAVTFRVGAYSPGGIAGRGWIALAAVYLGGTGGKWEMGHGKRARKPKSAGGAASSPACPPGLPPPAPPQDASPSPAARVWGCALAALVFTLAERAAFGIQRFGALPPTALLGLPPLAALCLYAASRDRASREDL